MSRSGFNPDYRFPDNSHNSPPTQPPPPYSFYHPNPAIVPPQTAKHGDADSDDDHDHEQGDKLHAHCEAARDALTAYGIPPAHHAQICIALDVSGSMESKNKFYSSGKIQRLIEKTMAIAIELSAGDKHTVTIFPFGRYAYDPIELDEHDLKNAVSSVMTAIGRVYSDATNYHAVVQRIRTNYFGDCAPLNKARIYKKDPVFAFFVTDGADNLEQAEAKNQFWYAQHEAIFFKFIALKGNDVNLQFPSLKSIGMRTKHTFLENTHLFTLNDPNELTIKLLLDAYRPWLEEAHEHDVLFHEPGVKLNAENAHDQDDIARMRRFEAEHGHEDLASKHGHVDAQPLLQHGLYRPAPKQRSRTVQQQYPRQEDCCRCTIS